MSFGLKDIPLTIEFLSNDDEKTPINIIGQKMLPILADSKSLIRKFFKRSRTLQFCA